MLSDLRYFFVKILTRYKTDLKFVITVPLQRDYCLTCIYNWIKLYCSKVKEF